MNIAKLRNYLEELSKDTFYGDLDRAEVVRGLIELDAYVPKDINDNVVLSGTTAATTNSYLTYGVNNVTVSSPTAYAIRLPYPPVKGKQVIIVNNSAYPITVFPSVNGGSINNVVDGSGVIPNDGKAYTFYCYENPLPGGWTWTPPATNQIVIAEMSFAHTTGTPTYKVGVGGSLTNSFGAAVSGGNLVLTGNWLSQPTNSTATRLKCYTNILPTDMASTFLPDAIQASVITARKDSASSATSGTLGDGIIFFGQNSPFYEGSYTQTGSLSSPPLVGDTGTMYKSDLALPSSLFPANKIGIGGQFSKSYYTFGMSIPASAISKTYRFQFFLEYN